MEKKYKAQVSVEMLAIVGVVILGALVFASYYLSSVNRNIDQLEQIDPDFSEFLPGDETGSFPGLPDLPGGGGIGGGGGNPLCGNNVINSPPEQCDGTAVFTQTCSSLGFGAGSLTCNSFCRFDASACDSFSAGCGNDILEASEQCEMNTATDPASPMYNGNPSCTAYCIGQGYITGSGSISCNAGTCDIDYDGCTCTSSPFQPFLLKLEPSSASANQDVGFETELSVDFDPDGDGTANVEWVDVNVTVQTYNALLGSNVPTDLCKYNNTTIPANASGLYINRFEAVANMPNIKDVSCSADGVYTFTFNGVDDLGNPGAPIVFEFTVPLQDDNPLCAFQDNATGTFDVCVNNFQTATVVNGNGEATFFVNHPDFSEVENQEPACVSSVLGDVCFSLGFT